MDLSELREGLTRDLGPAPSFAHRCLVDAACTAAAQLALGRALDGMTGKIANVDVWYLLGLDPYERSMPEQRRLTEVMRVLGWRRKIIRHNAQRVGRGFRRGLDTRTIFVFRSPVTQEIYHIGHEPQPTEVKASKAARCHRGRSMARRAGPSVRRLGQTNMAND